MKRKKITPPPEPGLETQLLTPKTPFARAENYLAYYSMYSGKLKRRIHCEGADAFGLAIWLEVDGEVRKYNERPEKLDVNSSVEQKSRSVKPAATSIGAGKSRPTLHVIQRKGAEPIDWESWASSHDCQLKRWTIEDLQIGSMLMANRERLLRFSSHAGMQPDLGLQDKVIEELMTVKRLTVYGLLGRMVGHEEQKVLAAIATLILLNKVTASIEDEEFDLSTELRVVR